MAVALSDSDERMHSGQEGAAARLAMQLILAMAEVSGADRLIDIASAHIDGCLYHGQASLDFAERMASAGARVAVPTTLNVGMLDLIHPELYRGDPQTAAAGRRLMDLYVEMGCRPTFTCAPYQLPARPAFGEHVAWAESNAIVFANSVLGARTDRYGDFIDICAAVTGRVPDAGLHRTENRSAQVVFDLEGLPESLLADDGLYPVLGHLIGMESATLIPVIVGLPPDASEDDLKALGAAAASSGSVALFHAVGVTPEAPTLEAALQGGTPVREVAITAPALGRIRASLSTTAGERLSAVSVGTPHFSVNEFARLTPLLDGLVLAPGVEFFVSTSRHVLDEVRNRGWLPAYERAGVEIVVDTCTYITPILRAGDGMVMTNSAKWAYYAPGNIGVGVAFGSLAECVRSAAAGKVLRDPGPWDGDAA
jgi:predicted aconitase